MPRRALPLRHVIHSPRLCDVIENQKSMQQGLYTRDFRSCELSQKIWRSSPLGIVSNSTGNVNIEHWVINFMSLFFQQDDGDAGRLVTFCSILWSLWLHRNEILFRGMSVNMEGILHGAQSPVQRWEKAQELQASRRLLQGALLPKKTNTKITVFTHGHCRGGGFISVVVDASWKAKKKVKQKHWTAAIGWEEETNHTPRVKGA
ncbi:uncharacterized protein [Spinacia oleracea]|uniref:Uncharacterized protein n=1 Tax=Spinacia oleracea TaxID=3562 RepID=A0ABM3RIZ7_SPIOL|nr:uncharacterized protein LOC130470038 [Spinacia oleracea]